MNIDDLKDFLNPINLLELSEDEGYSAAQLGSKVSVYTEHMPPIEEADIIILGCGEYRGMGISHNNFDAANAIRKSFYSLFYWHKNIALADLGNIETGLNLEDSKAAIKTVLAEVLQTGKKVVILGGSHDIALTQSDAYKKNNHLHDIVNIDAKIDLEKESPAHSDSFLLELFTQSPNYVRHYTHLGFQSYFVQPHMLETIDKLRFDCVRLGHVKDSLEETEPFFRNSDMATLDISAFASASAPANKLTPNGFNGEEMCTLFQYMGMSDKLQSIGVYNYQYEADIDDFTAKQLSHCLWYLIDGIYKAKNEADLHDEMNFNEYHLAFSEVKTVFKQSKKTGRWWMQMPSGHYLACSYNDYLLASQNEVPERWLRAIERES